MGTCWNCRNAIILKDEETKCDRCGKIVRYWCWNCKIPFDIQDKESLKKRKECKWCSPRFFICPNCSACSPTCSKYEHKKNIVKILNESIPPDKYNKSDKSIQKIMDYFEERKNSFDKTTRAFGVPKTYAKEKIKGILARMEGFKVKSSADMIAFEKRHEETLDKDIGFKFIIKQIREDESYGQEYRDVFNLCVCLGELKHKKEKFKNEAGIDVEFNTWIRVQELPCPNFDKEKLIVGYCSKCKGSFPKTEKYCDKCIYKKDSKNHKKGDKKMLVEKLSNNPTCKNLGGFKKRRNGKSEFKGED